MKYKDIKNKTKDEINLVLLEDKGIITKKEHNIILTYFYALGVKPDFTTITKGKKSCLYNKYTIINNYYDVYLSFYKVKKDSMRYKNITKLIKYLKELK